MSVGLNLNSAMRTNRASRGNRATADNGSGNQTENSTALAGAFAAESVVGSSGAEVDSFADDYRKPAQGTPRTLESFVHDESEASIRIINENTKQDMISAYTKFILESVQEAHAERQQIVETFGDYYVFMFGERPPMYNFGGTLINTKNVNWVSDFMLMYERYLRGTRCAEQKTRVLLTYGGRQVEGYMLNTSNQTAASNQEGVQFSFQLLVTSRKFLGISADMASSLRQTNDPGLNAVVETIASPGAEGSSEPDTSDAINGARDAVTRAANPNNLINISGLS